MRATDFCRISSDTIYRYKRSAIGGLFVSRRRSCSQHDLMSNATRVGPLGPEHEWRCVCLFLILGEVMSFTGHYSPNIYKSILKFVFEETIRAIAKTRPQN